MRLQRFCCCCTLSTGTLVIGTAGWILTCLELIALSSPTDYSSPSTGDPELDAYVETHYANKHRRDLFAKIGYGVVSLLVCVLLVIGVYKKDRRFILPWLVLKCFEGILTVIGTALFFILACMYVGDPDFPVWILFVMSFVLVIVSVLVWYTWLCVYSYYKITGEGVQQGPPPVYYTPPVNYTTPGFMPPTTAPPAYQEKSQYGLA